jgi:hypothetical protein
VVESLLGFESTKLSEASKLESGAEASESPREASKAASCALSGSVDAVSSVEEHASKRHGSNTDATAREVQRLRMFAMVFEMGGEVEGKNAMLSVLCSFVA